MRFLITGATGFIGRHFLAALTEGGHQAVVLARDPERAGKLLPGIPIFEWNGVIGLPPEPAFAGVDVVVNLIGESVARRWNHQRKLRFRDSRVLPTRALVERMAGLTIRPRAMISIVGSAFYGNRGDEVLTESSVGGDGFLAKLSQEWEAAMTGAAELAVRTVAVRSGVVLGRDGGILPRILTPFRLGMGARLGSGQQYLPWIHIADLIGILLHAAIRPDVSGAVNGVAPEPVTNMEFTAALGRALKRPTALSVPAAILKLALGEMAEEMLLSSQRVSPIRVLETQFQFKFPLLAQALADLLQPAPASK